MKNWDSFGNFYLSKLEQNYTKHNSGRLFLYELEADLIQEAGICVVQVTMQI
jgi:hypothetical protein